MKKDETKYAILRSKEDIKKLKEVKDLLNEEKEFYVTDSSVYRDLPDLYLFAVKTTDQLRREIQDLTAKVEDYGRLQEHINGILDFCKVKPTEKR